MCVLFVSSLLLSSSSVVLGDDAMREKLDVDDVYKELVYISKSCFCVVANNGGIG